MFHVEHCQNKGENNMSKKRANRGKTLKWVDGSTWNDKGVEFSRADQKKLVSLVNSVNRKKKRLTSGSNLQAQMLGFDYSKKGRARFGDGYDMLFAEHSKSLHQFSSREEFENTIRQLETMAHRNYVENQISAYKDMFIKGIETVTNEDESQRELIDHLKAMTNEEFSKRVQSGFIQAIEFIYGQEDYESRIASIRNRVGLDAFDGEIFTDAFPTPKTRTPYKPKVKKPKAKQPKTKTK